MKIVSGRREWIEIASIAAVSFVLYQFNMLILFLIPVQILISRRGAEVGVTGAAIVFIATALTGVARLGSVDVAELRRSLIFAEVAIPAVFLGSLSAININWPWGHFRRRLLKLSAVTVAIAAMSIPAILFVSGNDALKTIFESQIEALREMLLTAQEGESTLRIAADALGDVGQITELVFELILRYYVFFVFAFLASSIWLGEIAASRTTGRSRPRLTEFFVPQKAVWIVILSWAGVLLDLLTELGPLRYAFWNVGMISLFVYGMQGIGIIRHQLIRRGASGWIRAAVAVGLVLMLFWPGVNFVVIVGVPGIGVSETWIHYRNRDRKGEV